MENKLTAAPWTALPFWNTVCVMAYLLLLPSSGFALFNKVQDIDDVRIRRVVVSKTNPSFVAAASENTLYSSMETGRNFQKLFVLKGEEIHHLHIDSSQSNTLYLAGTRNCYRIDETAKRIFTAGESANINYITKKGTKLYIGTSQGLYYAEESLLNWKIVPGLRNNNIYSMEPFGGNLYIACDAGVYVMQSDESLDRLFITRNGQESSGIRVMLVRADPMTPGRLWLCTTKGVFYSSDEGQTWQRFFISGVGNVVINQLAQPPMNADTLYVCSNSGLFKVDIDSGESTPLFEGISTSKIRWMDFTATGDIYLATDQGLFRNTRSPDRPVATPGNLQDLLAGEPSIEEVQEAALYYNSVHPQKTGSWRKRVKYRALMPRLSLDYDKTIGSSFTSSGYYYAEGPNDWGVSLTWDLDELIWNSYEDDIDNRTKLTTQLRMDILDEVNRLYFERLRLKHELAKADPNSEGTFLQELRYNELTATLDGYTGGLYSQRP